MNTDWKWLKLLTLLVSVALTDAVKATDTIGPTLLPACVCTFNKWTLLNLHDGEVSKHC